MLWLALLTAPVSFAQTTYYVAANGNDSNDGRSVAQPFQTIGKVNTVTLQAGDQVLFRRGDTFRGTLTVRQSGTAGQPIGFDAYGSGPAPVLAGSVAVTNWTNLGGNVWQATCANCGTQVTGLHRNRAALPLGRYPNLNTANKGYLTVQSHVNNGQLTSQQALPLNLNTGWQGGEVVHRAVQWIIDRAAINQQNGNTLTLAGQTLTYPIHDGWGFFVQNHPATLDQPGEWCFNPATKVIQLYDSSSDPNAQTITATAYRTAVDLTGVSFVSLRNLHLTETLNQGLLAHNVTNLTMANLDITNSGEDGMQVTGTGHTVALEQSRIVGANNNGVRVGANNTGGNPDRYQNVTLRGNLVRRIGVLPGRGKGGDGHYNGVHVGADQNVLIEDNVVDSIGYNAVSFWNNTLVQRNVITNYCMAKSDGGGIYIWNGIQRPMSNIRVRSNMVYNGIGAPEGTPNGAYSGVNGIFFDDCVSNVELTNNTTFNNRGLGIFLHSVANMVVRNNTSFGNREGQLDMRPGHEGCPPRNNIIKNNVFVSRLFDEFNVKYESYQNDLALYGQIDSNYYVRPFEKQFVVRAVWNYGPGTRGADFNIEEWRSRFGKDERTVASPVAHKDYQITEVFTPARFASSFDANLAGWSVLLNQPGSGRLDWDGSGPLDGGSLRVSFPQPSGETWFFNSRVMAAFQPGPLQAGTYRLSFDAVATSATKRVQAFLQKPGTPSFYFNAHHQVLVGTNRQRYEVVFTLAGDVNDYVAGFQVYEDGQTVWFDNVQFEKVTTTLVNPDDRMRLIYNPTNSESVVALNGTYRDVNGQVRSGSVTLAPFTSLALFAEDNTTPPPVTLREPENPANAVAGLDYRYYEGSWSQLPDFTSLTPAKTGTASQPDLSVRNRDSEYALRFTGYVDVPTDGTYTFYTTSDDGSKLYIGSTEVVNNDAPNSGQERSGTIGLKAGKHALTVAYVQGTGGQSLSVSYGGPNVSKQVIPAGVLYRVTSTTTTPTITLREPENPANAVAGLDYHYYEGNWDQLPNFDALTPIETGTVNQPDISVRNRDDGFGLRFTGYVDVPADGTYTFYTTSDDGSKLLIGNAEVVNNDGSHGSQERSGTIGLKAGKHALRVLYLENGGGEELSISYSGPNLTKQVVPAGALYRVSSTTTAPPSSTTTTPPSSTTTTPPTTPPTTTLRDADNPANAVAGLDYRYYEGNWSQLPNFDALTPVKTGTASLPDIAVRNRNDFFGLRFTGYVDVPTDGLYTFYVSSDDGSKLLIGSTEIVNHDGTHAQTEKSGTIGLKAGKHALTMLYFENAGGEGLSVSYSGSNVSKQVIPAGAFYRVSSTTTTPPSSTTTTPPTTPPTTALREPENPADAVAGLDYRYYEGTWGQLPNFDALTPVKTGTASLPDLTMRNRNDGFGLRFTGYVDVSTDGVYTFFTNSDDGSKLYIGSTEIVNNDGGHAIQERSGTIGLKAGKHALRVIYFENSGGEGLSVSYSGPNVTKRAIPAGAFYRVGTATPPSTPGTGTGLRAEYFNNRNLTGNPVLTRTDATVDFDWGNGSPAPMVNADNFSVRWTGQVEAPATGNFTFTTISDDGVRLWVNGVQVINNWTGHAPTTDNSPSVALTAGQRYDIRMEYFDSGSGAVARLRWAYPGQSQQVIPQIRLYPAGGGGRLGASAAVTSNSGDVDGMVVYPVPARDELRIRYSTPDAGRVTVQLLNALGQSVWSAEEPVEAGENQLRVGVRSYPRGFYVLTLTQDNRRLTHKVLLTE